MKAELQKFFKLFEELEEASETASLTLVTKGASQPSSYSLNLHHLYPPLQLQLLLNPCHQLLIGAAVIVAQERGPVATSGQLPTRQRQPLVPHWTLPVPLCHLLPGDAG